MKIFCLATSLRKDSYNKKLIKLCADYCGKEHDVEFADFTDFDLPLYNQDAQESEGIPENAKKFGQKLVSADKIIFSVPEYNYSIPGSFKNLIDWVSRIQPMPFKGTKILLVTASPAMAGGTRSFWATRIPLEGCGSFVYPSSFALSVAHQAFDDKGSLKDPMLVKSLNALLDEFVGW